MIVGPAHLAVLLALALYACGPVPGSRPTATFGYARSPTPDLTRTPATLSPQATVTEPAYPPPATAGATDTPGAYVPPPDTATASLTPRESHTPRPSPAPTQSPTATPDLSPTPDPHILSVAEVPCEPAGGFMRCTDPVLGLTFEQPAAWGPITATLRESFAGAGLAYEYQYADMPGIIQAGGRSADFTEGRGATLTDFSGSGTLGFNDKSPEEWCEGLGGTPVLCSVVQPNVVLDLRFPEAEYLCLDSGQYFFTSPLAFVWVLLPDHPQINGFVFVAPFLSDEAADDLLDLRRDILGWDGSATHTACGPEQQAEFDEAITAFIATLDGGQADPDTLANVAALRHLAESITE